MPVKVKLVEHRTVEIVFDTDDEGEALHAVSKLYSNQDSSPGHGSVTGFGMNVSGTYPIDAPTTYRDCTDCFGRGGYKVDSLPDKITIRCESCKGTRIAPDLESEQTLETSEELTT